MRQDQYFAIIPHSRRGKAVGVGISEADAWDQAATWARMRGETVDGSTHEAVEITLRSYRRMIGEGRWDQWEEV